MNAAYATTLAHPRSGWGHMYDDSWTWLWGSLMMLFWFAVIVLAVWLVIRLTGARGLFEPKPHGTERARDILAERYARGEIDTEEYEQRLSKLG